MATYSFQLNTRFFNTISHAQIEQARKSQGLEEKKSSVIEKIWEMIQDWFTFGHRKEALSALSELLKMPDCCGGMDARDRVILAEVDMQANRKAIDHFLTLIRLASPDTHNNFEVSYSVDSPGFLNLKIRGLDFSLDLIWDDAFVSNDQHSGEIGKKGTLSAPTKSPEPSFKIEQYREREIAKNLGKFEKISLQTEVLWAQSELEIVKFSGIGEWESVMEPYNGASVNNLYLPSTEGYALFRAGDSHQFIGILSVKHTDTLYSPGLWEVLA